MSALFDRAYALHKQGTDARRAHSLAQLATEFPQGSGADFEAAFDSAGALIGAACQWAEEKRGPNNDGTGTPTISLQERCPGFSAHVYSDAEAWGLYLTK
jgi:hypothetical protein